MTAPDRRRLASPTRVTLTAVPDDELAGAWWPHTASIARELPELIDALQQHLGRVVDIAVNWSAFESAMDLDSLGRRGIDALPGFRERHHRVIAVTGTRRTAKLLVVPARTTRGLALMVLRQAADLPVPIGHVDSPAYHAAEDIVAAARRECVAAPTSPPR